MAFQSRSGAKASDLSASENPPEAARELLLRHLTRGPKSKAQLATILAKHNCPEDLAEELLNRYSDVGLIDDKAFAKALVNTRRGLKKLAKSAIKRELLSAGVSENDFAEALDSLTNESELELAIELAEKRLRSVSNLPYEAQQRRVSAFLGRRGFSQGLISEAIRKARQQVN